MAGHLDSLVTEASLRSRTSSAQTRAVLGNTKWSVAQGDITHVEGGEGEEVGEERRGKEDLGSHDHSPQL